MQSALGHERQLVKPLIQHIPHAHGKVIPMTAMNVDAFEAVAVMGACLLTGTMVIYLIQLL